MLTKAPWLRAEQADLVLSPASNHFFFMENCSCRGMWEQQPLLCISELHLWGFWGGREKRKKPKVVTQVGHQIKGGIYHLGHLSMCTFRVTNRIKCLNAGNERLWNMEGGRGSTPPHPWQNGVGGGFSYLCIPHFHLSLGLTSLLFAQSWITKLEPNPGTGVQNCYGYSHQITEGSHSNQQWFGNIK